MNSSTSLEEASDLLQGCPGWWNKSVGLWWLSNGYVQNAGRSWVRIPFLYGYFYPVPLKILQLMLYRFSLLKHLIGHWFENTVLVIGNAPIILVSHLGWGLTVNVFDILLSTFLDLRERERERERERTYLFFSPLSFPLSLTGTFNCPSLHFPVSHSVVKEY